jgi:hypothetical protein
MTGFSTLVNMDDMPPPEEPLPEEELPPPMYMTCLRIVCWNEPDAFTWGKRDA